MTPFQSALNSLIAAADALDLEAVQSEASALLGASGGLPQTEIEAALQKLASVFENPDGRIGGIAAIAGGALIERTNDLPGGFGAALLERMPAVLTQVVSFIERIEAALPPEPEDGGTTDGAEEEYENEDEEGGLRIGERRVPEDVFRNAITEDNAGGTLFMALDQWCLPAIACLTRDITLRQAAKARHPEMLNQALSIGSKLPGPVQFLGELLQLLDDEPLLVFHVPTGRGFRCRIGGISDNFQLHMLLAGALVGGSEEAPAEKPARGGLLSRLFGGRSNAPEPVSRAAISPGLPGERPSPEVLRMARGEGPQEIDGSVRGVWNLLQWTALDGQKRLPTGSGREEDGIISFEGGGVEHWVWNEGVPADIACFESTRVLLLGPPAYERSWNANRHFGALKAYVTVESEMPAGEATAFLNRLAADAAARRGGSAS